MYDPDDTRNFPDKYVYETWGRFIEAFCERGASPLIADQDGRTPVSLELPPGMRKILNKAAAGFRQKNKKAKNRRKK